MAKEYYAAAVEKTPGIYYKWDYYMTWMDQLSREVKKSFKADMLKAVRV